MKIAISSVLLLLLTSNVNAFGAFGGAKKAAATAGTQVVSKGKGKAGKVAPVALKEKKGKVALKEKKNNKKVEAKKAPVKKTAPKKAAPAKRKAAPKKAEPKPVVVQAITKKPKPVYPGVSFLSYCCLLCMRGKKNSQIVFLFLLVFISYFFILNKG